MSRGLAVSGGSAKGAFAVGVIQKLREKYDVSFDLISGTSTGALIAPLAVTGEYTLLEKMYSNFSTAKTLVEQNPVEIYNSGYVFDMSGLRRTVEEIYTEERYRRIVESPKRMFITTVNMQTGKVVYFFTGPDAQFGQDVELDRIESREMLIDCVLASAMQPVLMETIEIKGHQYVDGGVKETVPIKILIDNGAEEIFSVILTSENEQASNKKYKDFIQTLKRTIDMFSQEVVLNDIRVAEFHEKVESFCEVTKKRLKQEFAGHEDKIDRIFESDNPFKDTRLIRLHEIRPKKKLIEDSLIFDEADMRRMIRLGRERVDELYPHGISQPRSIRAFS